MTVLNPPLDPARVALQLYTVRSLTQADLLGTLRRVAEAGYRAVEFAGWGTLPVSELRVELDTLGLGVAGAHVPVPQWEARPDGVVADLQTLGSPFGVVPWVPEERRSSRDAARRLAADLNRWGERCRAGGLGFAYHHHAFEFAPLPDAPEATLFDLLVAETDPALVGFEVDVFWAAAGGRDPVALLESLAGRVPLVHLKDRGEGAGPDGTPSDAPAGEGNLPWNEIVPAAEAAGARWFITEQDHPGDPLADATTAWRNLTGVAG